MPSLWSRARRPLGRLQYQLRVATVGRLLKARANATRQRSRELLRQLPAVTVTNGDDFDLVMVCGAAEVEMAMWSCWSFARHLPGANMTMILDGAMAAEDRALLERLVHGIRLVHREEADQLVALKAANYPHILEWRNSNRTGRKLADPHLWSTAAKVLIVDSDVLCFKPPQALVEQLTRPVESYTWNQDFAYSYVTSRDVLKSVIGAALPDRVNSGLMLHPRSTAETFEFLELLLRKIKADGRIKYTDRWFEQTLAAACVARFAPQSVPLPKEYAVRGGATRARDVLRHFVGSPLIRPRFYSEGIPLLLTTL